MKNKAVTKMDARSLAYAYGRVVKVRAGDELSMGEWHKLKFDCEILDEVQTELGIELVPSERLQRMVEAWKPLNM